MHTSNKGQENNTEQLIIISSHYKATKIQWVINQLNGSFSLRCNEQLILINEPIIIFLYKNISWNRESYCLSAPDCLYKTNKVYKLGMRKRDKNQCNRHWVAEEYINTSFDLKKNTTMKKCIFIFQISKQKSAIQNLVEKKGPTITTIIQMHFLILCFERLLLLQQRPRKVSMSP